MFSRIRQVAPMCPHGMAHLRHLGSTIELSAAAMRPYVKVL